MDFVQNFPCFSILLCMFAGIISSALNGKSAKLLNRCVLILITVMSAVLLVYLVGKGESFVYVAGSFPAPWGNELRAGVLEAGMALFFCIIMLLSLLGGGYKLDLELEHGKEKLYYIMINLLMSSLLALIYTNDMFTAYVFVEINTISACGLIMIRQWGRTIEAATRYMIMSLLGSGLLLMGLVFLYGITGHLLMSNIHTQVVQIAATETYRVPLMVTIALICVGLAIKSALFPFHNWLPDAYGYSTVSSAAILSSLVSKGYIFLLIKIIYRVIGFNIIQDSKVINILFVFGLAGMIFGSLSAMKEKDIRRMIAYSSVAQIGYIYMGFGLGTTAGMIASIFHIISHAASKSLLFVSAAGLSDVSGDSTDFFDLTGAAYRNKAAGAAFTVGSLSMVGLPLFAGFISKLLFAQAAAISSSWKMLPTLVVLALSTILNAIYFMKTVVRIYTPVKWNAVLHSKVTIKDNPVTAFALFLFIVLNILLGMCSQPVMNLINSGLHMFA
ncbi:MAG: proton-conducting transporter membrane subunit [Lachnospiraceae bacterium]|nr:proton-conducting transporter membrane subunit [Lachnospiraceae bacterium]